jgi:hypothetical protein
MEFWQATSGHLGTICQTFCAKGEYLPVYINNGYENYSIILLLFKDNLSNSIR